MLVQVVALQSLLDGPVSREQHYSKNPASICFYRISLHLLIVRHICVAINDFDITRITKQTVALACGELLHNAQLFQMAERPVYRGRSDTGLFDQPAWSGNGMCHQCPPIGPLGRVMHPGRKNTGAYYGSATATIEPFLHPCFFYRFPQLTRK